MGVPEMELTSPTTPPPADRWEAAGRRIAGTLDNRAAAVVIGEDTAAAAQVALGIGRVQARRRRVAVGDLVGEEPMLQSLVPADAEYGLADTFLHGVSLGHVAYPIDPAHNL